MTPKTREDFAPDIGGFLDNVDGDIVDAVFEIASGKYADQVMMGGSDAKPPIVITLTVESPALEKPANQSYSVGSSNIWEIVDGGKAIVHTSPDKHSFRKGSIAWHLVEAMMNAAGGGDLDKGQEFFVNRDHYMTEVEFFTGLSYHWAVTEIKTEIGKGHTVISHPPLPEVFLGEMTGKAGKAGKAGTPDTDELDTILIANASGKTDKELKSFAVRNADIKKNDVYMKAVVSGKKLKELEDKGDLTKDPDTGMYL